MMALFRLILLAVAMFFTPLKLDAAQEPQIQNPAPGTHEVSATEARAEVVHEHEKAEGLPLYASPVFHVGPLPVTNSMIVTWAVALLLILGAQLATRNIKDVPEG